MGNHDVVELHTLAAKPLQLLGNGIRLRTVRCKTGGSLDVVIPVPGPHTVRRAAPRGPGEHLALERDPDGRAQLAQDRLGIGQQIPGVDDRGHASGSFAHEFEDLDLLRKSRVGQLRPGDHGKERIFVFAGGESDPAHGGLLTLDPNNGKIYDRFFWRADMYTSVNAATPVVLGDRVFITECYKTGGVMLKFDAESKSEVAYKTPDAASHWTTPVSKDGHLYVVDGRHQQTAELVCIEVESGEEKWRESIDWEIDVGGARPFNVGFQRGAILKVDGAFLALGELGSLLWLDLTPEGVKVISKAQLFTAPQTWTLPAVHRGLLYISQHEGDPFTKSGPRLLCYDLRKP